MTERHPIVQARTSCASPQSSGLLFYRNCDGLQIDHSGQFSPLHSRIGKTSTDPGHPVKGRVECKLCENLAIKWVVMYSYYTRDILW